MQKRTLIRKTSEETGDDSTSSDDEFFGQVVRHLKQVKKIRTDNYIEILTVKIENLC